LRKILVILFLAAAAHGAELRVSAAASLTEALTELANNYRGGDEVIVNFGASALLARQISEGAPVDLFISADDEQMNRVSTTQRISLVSNRLAIVGKPLLESKRIAMANPATGPAGVYAKEWLTRSGLWARLADRIIPTENVRGALAAVESGNVDCAIVYATDAKLAPNLRVDRVVLDGPRISYPAGVIRGAKNVAGAVRFLMFLRSPAAKNVFRRYGFIVQ
jgi:molybdate transport system substrate-binding protein